MSAEIGSAAAVPKPPMLVTCSRCGATAEPQLVEGKRRSLPDGWLQVQVTDHIGLVRNAVLCGPDGAAVRRALVRSAPVRP